MYMEKFVECIVCISMYIYVTEFVECVCVAVHYSVLQCVAVCFKVLT